MSLRTRMLHRPSHTPSYAHAKPAPRKAASPPRSITDDVTWTRIVEPRERYRIVYLDRDNNRSERIVELSKIGHSGELGYLGVLPEGKFKTMRADRIVEVLEQLTTGDTASIHPAPQYATVLPAFPIENAVYKMPATHLPSWVLVLTHSATLFTTPQRKNCLPQGVP